MLQKTTKKEIAKVVTEWVKETNKRRGEHNQIKSTAHMWAPLRKGCGLKREGMVKLNEEDQLIEGEISASILFHTETDGSSHPTGGLRETSQAAAYMSWDIRSPLMLVSDYVCIPSSFVSFHGHALDHKTPLLRSQDAVGAVAAETIKLVTGEDRVVRSNCGWEQEFFLVPTDIWEERSDLMNTGRALLGALPPKHQQMSDHYMCKQSPEVEKLFQDFEAYAKERNIALNVGHAEVAPTQHEFSPIYTLGSISADQNLLVMHEFENYAEQYGFKVLYHEKPYAGINGSGKHTNWSLETTKREGLYTFGNTKMEQERFMVFLAGVVRALDMHGDMLRAAVATASNDHRLGAQEAPPAIISLYTGHTLEKHVKAIIEGGELYVEGSLNASTMLSFGSSSVVPMKKAPEDRNRTAPFPYSGGNRFEFRAVGSSQNVSWPLTVINVVIADAMDYINTLIKEKGVTEAVRDVFAKHQRVIFNGDGYSKEWPIEAVKRGLVNNRTTPEALRVLTDEKNLALFEKYNVFTRDELTARQQVGIEDYNGTIDIEAETLIRMINQSLVPATVREMAMYKDDDELYAEKKTLLSNLRATTKKLANATTAVPEDLFEAGMYYANTILPCMENVREAANAIELTMDKHQYPFPTMEEIIYYQH